MIRAGRLSLTTALAIALTAFAAAGAQAAEIKIKNARSGEVKTVQFDASAADVEADYVLRGTSGEQTQRIKGVSLARILELAGADPVYTAVEVARAGGAVPVSKYLILGQGLVPVVYEDGGNLVFVRPSSGAGDLNANDVVTAGTLELTQIDLGALDVKVTASKKKIKAGQSVKFAATASGGGAGDKYAFKWNFNDGSTGNGASVAHRFKKRGTYRVLVGASIVGSDRSDPAVVTIQVGEPTKSKKKRTGGGTNDSANAPAGGVADGDSGDGDEAGSGERQKPKKRREPSPEPAVDPNLPVIEGELLAATSAPEPVEQSSLAARSGQQPQEAKSAGSSLPREAWAAIGAIALIGSGMLFEFGVPAAARRRLRGIS